MIAPQLRYLCNDSHVLLLMGLSNFTTATQDEKMFRVVRDHERWFQVVMGENYEVDEAATDRQAARISLPSVVQQQLAMKLHP